MITKREFTEKEKEVLLGFLLNINEETDIELLFHKVIKTVQHYTFEFMDSRSFKGVLNLVLREILDLNKVDNSEMSKIQNDFKEGIGIPSLLNERILNENVFTKTEINEFYGEGERGLENEDNDLYFIIYGDDFNKDLIIDVTNKFVQQFGDYEVLDCDECNDPSDEFYEIHTNLPFEKYKSL